MPAVFPEPSIRTAWETYCYVHAGGWGSDHPIVLERLERVMGSLSDDARDQLADDFAVIWRELAVIRAERRAVDAGGS